ncbi:MAG: aminotransferase class V-fold PLP-dependent enzyme, partial [Pseudomonadota bacterium]
GGGQEMGRRSGTESLILIAGLAAAATASQKDLASGRWDAVAELRNILEKAIEDAAPGTIFVGQDAARLPNTSCFISRGWKGETQVMAMDLAGFAVSAGSACSSGKVKASNVLPALGYDDSLSACALRVSLGLETTEDDVLRFAESWARQHEKIAAKLAAE